MATKKEEHTKRRTTRSKELIAQAYAAIYSEPSVPTGSPVPVVNVPTPGNTVAGSVSHTPASSMSSSRSKHLKPSHAVTRNVPGQQTVFASSRSESQPVATSYKQPRPNTAQTRQNEVTSAQLPPPTGTPYYSISKPQKVSKQTLSTSSGSQQFSAPSVQRAPSPQSRQGTTAVDRGTQGAQGIGQVSPKKYQRKQSQGGCISMFIWLILIGLLLYHLLNIFFY